MNVPLRQAIPDAPFTTLLGVVKTYCRPDAHENTIEDLRFLLAREDEEMHVFTEELRMALTDPPHLPRAELRRAGGYSHGRDQDFLRRLWLALFGEEPTVGAGMRLLPSPGADRPPRGSENPPVAEAG